VRSGGNGVTTGGSDADPHVAPAGALSTGRGRGKGRDKGRETIAWIESLVLGALLPGVGWMVSAHDPFFESRPFSWFVLPPLLAGLRHGFAAGCASAVVLGATMVVGWRLRVFGGATFPGEALLGMMSAAMISGHVADVWRRETERARAALETAGRRASAFARAHFLLQLSHERLEEQNPGTAHLREALARIRQLAPAPGAPWNDVGSSLMSILARYAMLEIATLLAIDAKGEPAGVLATLGHPPAVDPADPVFREAARTRELTYVDGSDASVTTSPPTVPRLLAAVPVVDGAGTLHGMLCVHSMPFFAFSRKNLEALAMFAGHFADVAARPGGGFDPDQERANDFHDHLGRAIYDRRVFGVPSVVAVVAFAEGSELASMADVLLAASLRPRDFVYRTRNQRGDSIWLLLPLAEAAQGRQLLGRLDELARKELGRTIAQAGGASAFRATQPSDRGAALVAELERDLDRGPGQPSSPQSSAHHG
jgi:hypothetical protein